MMNFSYQYDETHPKISVELHPDSTWDEAVEAFEVFLRAAGYVFDGHVDVVDTEEAK